MRSNREKTAPAPSSSSSSAVGFYNLGSPSASSAPATIPAKGRDPASLFHLPGKSSLARGGASLTSSGGRR
jgi:hypothetical protein